MELAFCSNYLENVSLRGRRLDDVIALGKGLRIWRRQCKSLSIKKCDDWGGVVSKNIRNCVTSFMGDPLSDHTPQPPCRLDSDVIVPYVKPQTRSFPNPKLIKKLACFKTSIIVNGIA